MSRARLLRVLLVALALALPTGALAGQLAEPENSEPATGSAGTAEAAAQRPPAATPAPRQVDEDIRVNRAQPDFTLVNLPTSLRLPRFKSSFRVTHRFVRPLGLGDFGDLVEDLFGLDGGALIGLEYRFSLFRGTQIGIHRASDKTIQLFAQGDVVRQGSRLPFGITGWASIEGADNLQRNHSPTLGMILSRTFGERGAIYLEPFWVNNSNMLPDELGGDNDTVLLGLGARVRVRPTVYLVAEITPRVAGYDPGTHQASFAIEKRAGLHVFQLNFSNGFGTTMAKIARGGFGADDWYLGFNISRKFF